VAFFFLQYFDTVG